VELKIRFRKKKCLKKKKDEDGVTLAVYNKLHLWDIKYLNIHLKSNNPNPTPDLKYLSRKFIEATFFWRKYPSDISISWDLVDDPNDAQIRVLFDFINPDISRTLGVGNALEKNSVLLDDPNSEMERINKLFLSSNSNEEIKEEKKEEITAKTIRDTKPNMIIKMPGKVGDDFTRAKKDSFETETIIMTQSIWDARFQRTCCHEFGHALGFVHEFIHTGFMSYIDKEKVKPYIKAEMLAEENGIQKNELKADEKNSKLLTSARNGEEITYFGPHDPESIMNYEFSADAFKKIAEFKDKDGKLTEMGMHFAKYYSRKQPRPSIKDKEALKIMYRPLIDNSNYQTFWPKK